MSQSSRQPRPYAEAALDYWRAEHRGVLPLPPREKTPPPTGFTGWGGRWPSMADVVGWSEDQGGGNAALRLDEETLGIDVDAYGSKKGGETLARLEEELGALPATISLTSRGFETSRIRLYKVPPGHGWRDDLVDIELIHYGHRYVVVWPSVHPDTGDTYWWYDAHGEPLDGVPDFVDLPELPTTWVEFLAKGEGGGASKAEADIVELRAWYDALRGGDPCEPVEARRREAVDVLASQNGSLHNAARAASASLVGFGANGHRGVAKALGQVRDLFLLRAAKPGDSHRRPGVAESEWRRLITGAIRMQLDEHPLPDEVCNCTTVTVGGTTTTADDGEAVVGALADGHRPTDVGNAERLIEAGNDRIRYVHAWGRWLVYRHGRWQLDPNNALIRQVAKKVARQLFQLAASTTDKAERDAAWAWAKRSETSGAITAMVDLARGDPRVLTDHNLLDADPWSLNCRNGTVDLRTGQLRDHAPSDLITMTTGIDYDPDATSELWAQCLKTWQPDPDMRDYLQRVAGAGATGHPTQTLQIDHGEGANGKTVFYSTVAHSLGDYAGGIHKSLLITARHEQHDTVRADLFRRRLAVASETTDGHRLDEEKVKLLTGGDPIKARRMREDLWEFTPTHTIVLHSNYKPTVSGTNHAIWRRLRLVPWTETITNPDEGLAERLHREASAVLAWTVHGAVEFIANGLDTDPPEQVRTATADYRRSQDILGRFTDEVLEYKPGAFTFSQTLKHELEQWADAQGLDVPAFSALTAELAEHGCESGRNRTETGSQKRGWWGVRINGENAPTRENTQSVTDSDTPSHSPPENATRKGYTETPSQGVTEEGATFADALDLLDDYDTNTDRIAGL